MRVKSILTLLFVLSVFALQAQAGDLSQAVLAGGKGDLAKARQLLDQGADANEKDENQNTPLLWAATYGNAEIAKLLIEKGADVDARNKWLDTPLFLSIRKGNTDIAKLLIEKGADVNARDSAQWSTLHWAAYHGNTEIADLLIQKGVDVNTKNKFQDTPLLWAASQGKTEVARLLMKKGADVNAKDENKNTPAMRAEINKHIELAAMLRKADSVKSPVREASAAETNPAEAQRYFNRGLAAVEIAKTPDDYDLAISEFQKARTLDPARADIYYNLGLIQEKAGEFKDAASSLRQYLKLAPNSPDAETVRALVDKLEFKAEQVITDEEALDIFVSLTDSGRWQLNGITNATVFQNHAWIKSFSRSSQPGLQNRLFFEFRCGVCSPTSEGVCPGDALLIGKSVEFETFYCPCKGIECVFKYNYRLEVISRNKVKMLLKVRGYKGRTSEGTYEFVRR